MSRVYGKFELKDGIWQISGEKHFLIKIKRFFARISSHEFGTLTIKDSDEVSLDLKVFLARYNIEISKEDKRTLYKSARRHVETMATLDDLVDRDYVGKKFELAIPARNYQKVAAALTLKHGFLLLADDVGVGKTVTAFCVLTDPRALPAVVVTLSGKMPLQWQEMASRFLPKLQTHVIEKKTPYPLPKVEGRGPDLVILNYHKLSGWAEIFGEYAQTVIYDEAQELRRGGSDKYSAAEFVARRMRFRMGLSATPIFNMGGEIWNVVNVLQEDALGTSEEFHREWCQSGRTYGNRAAAVDDPKALGSYLRAEHIMLRRTRKELGRELPPLTKIPQYVESNREAFNEIEGTAAELAKIILSTEKLDGWDRMEAGKEFDQKLRQATGISKAPAVADFVRLLVEGDDETVLVYAWHRSVYDILMKKLEDLRPVMFTGTETPAKKAENFNKFVKRETRVMLMSLRAGQGLDGLQHVCRTVVVAELDWSPGVIEQCIGRVARDGQKDPVTAIYCLSDEGSDPVIAETLGLKSAQVEGLKDPTGEILEELQVDPNRIKELAKRYLKKQGIPLPEPKPPPEEKAISETKAC